MSKRNLVRLNEIRAGKTFWKLIVTVNEDRSFSFEVKPMRCLVGAKRIKKVDKTTAIGGAYGSCIFSFNYPVIYDWEWSRDIHFSNFSVIDGFNKNPRRNWLFKTKESAKAFGEQFVSSYKLSDDEDWAIYYHYRYINDANRGIYVAWPRNGQ